MQILKDDQEAEDVFIEANKGHVPGTPDNKRNKEKNERKTYKLEISFTLADNELVFQIFASRRKLNFFSHSSRPRLLSSPSASPNIQIQRLNSDTSDVSLSFCHVRFELYGFF